MSLKKTTARSRRISHGEMRAYTARTVIAAQRRVLAMAARVLRSEFPGRANKDRLQAYDGTLITIGEALEHIDQARRLKVKP